MLKQKENSMSKKIVSLLIVFMFVVVLFCGCSKIKGTGIIVDKIYYTTTTMIKSGNVFVPIINHHYMFYMDYNEEIIKVSVSCDDYHKYEIGNEYDFETFV
jgi:hypothetical protein